MLRGPCWARRRFVGEVLPGRLQIVVVWKDDLAKGLNLNGD